MDEQKKYETIKKLVDENGNKDRAAMALGITRRQVNRLIYESLRILAERISGGRLDSRLI